MTSLQNIRVQYSARLNSACEQADNCPPLHRGRLVWIVEQLRKNGIHVTVESVRKWLNGETRPRQDKSDVLAQILGVSPVELFLGDGLTGSAMERSSNVTSDKDAKLVVPIGLRPGVTVKVEGMPLDLTPAEATRIANIILAHAIADDPR